MLGIWFLLLPPEESTQFQHCQILNWWGSHINWKRRGWNSAVCLCNYTIKVSVVPRAFNVNEAEILTADFCFNENLNSGAQMAVEKKRRKRNSMTTYCKATHSSPWIRVISKCFPILLYITNSSIVQRSVMILTNSLYMNWTLFKLPLQMKISMQLQFFMVSEVCYGAHLIPSI